MSKMLLIAEQTMFKCLFVPGPVLRTLDSMFPGSHNDHIRYIILSVNSGSASLSNLLKVTQLRIHALNLSRILRKWSDK